MRRFPIPIVLGILASLMFASIASADHSNGAGPKKDLVAGTARLAGFHNPLIHLKADRDPKTGEAQGHFFIKYPPPLTTQISGRVTCLNVVGRGAAAVGIVEKSTGTAPFTVPAGTSVQVRVLDQGEPGTLDMANWDLSNACSGVGDLLLMQGNYIVHSEPPLELLGALDDLLAQFELAAGDH